MTFILTFSQFILYTHVLLKMCYGFYFEQTEELVVKTAHSDICKREHHLSFNNEIIKLCLFSQRAGANSKYNLIMNTLKEEKWEEKYRILKDNTFKIIKHFYTFVNKNELVIIFCFNKHINKASYECHRSITKVDDKKNEEQRVTINYNHIDPLSLVDYASNNFEFLGTSYLLICGINENRKLPPASRVFILCRASKDSGLTWGFTFSFYYHQAKENINYSNVVPKIFYNEIGFLFSSSENSGKKYIRCTYLEGYHFDCNDIRFIEDKYLLDVTKIRGYYLTILSNRKDKKDNIKLWYIYNSVITESMNNNITNVGKEYKEGNLFLLNDSTVLYNYVNEKDSYVYLIKHKGSVKHCTLLYLKKEYANPGFIKETVKNQTKLIKDNDHNNNNTRYVCNINYDDLSVNGHDRYFTVSVYNGVKTDIKSCFYFSYDNILEPVNIINKIVKIYEYSNYSVYAFYINKDIESYFLFNKKMECFLGENFYIYLNINFINTYKLDNSFDTNERVINLYTDNLIYYKIPNINYKNTFLSKIHFPPYTKYIQLNDKEYIFKLPSYIEQDINTELFFLQKVNKFYKKKTILHKGGHNNQLVLGIDFSKKNDICSYAYSKSSCEYTHIDINKINIKVPMNQEIISDITLAIICPVNKKNQNVCFHHTYDNGKKVLIRDYLYDRNGYLNVYPKIYIYTPQLDQIYEESKLVIRKEFIEIFKNNKCNYRNVILCKCYANNMYYDITFNLI
ncbi:6-cysteine protein [Plasmodium sp. DRC-Itaito]|nr:6-cysteine protein [Plasmodium sp. DRC-Itaito]